MFYSLGPDNVLETCVELVRPYVIGGDPRTNSVVALGLAWRRRLSDRQGDSMIDSPLIGWKWIADATENDYLAKRFEREDSYRTVVGDTLERSWPSRDDQQIVSDGWQLLCTQEPELGELASVLITTIFSTPSPRHPGSGSLPTRLGSIYINPTDDWGAPDVVECLIREVTHQMLWNDDQRYGHFPQPVPPFALGPVVATSERGLPVSLSKALSLVVVAAEILSYREQHATLDSPRDDYVAMARRSIFTAESIRGLTNIKSLSTGRFWRVLNAAEDRLAAKMS